MHSATISGGAALRLASIGALLLAVLVSVVGPSSGAALAFTQNPATVFINEIHYDNTGTDTGEAVEVAGPAGTDLTGWSIVLYNGSGGASYDTDPLSGSIPDQGGGFGTVVLSYASNGIQNGSPDGVALVNGATVVQFLSYEGSFAATNGPATGVTSTDIGVSQSGTEAVGSSIQLQGTGTTYQDFTWVETEGSNTFGAFNASQSFGVVVNQPIVTACPTGLSTLAGTPATAPVSASDADGTVTDVTITSAAVAGISLTGVTPGSTLNATLSVDATAAAGTYSVVLSFTSSNSPSASCTVPVTVTSIIPIGTVQGSVGPTANGDTFRSSFAPASGNGAGQQVVVQGVIYQKVLSRTSAGVTNYGFFIQNSAATADSDPDSSDGIFVFQNRFPDLIGGYVPQVGDEVVIRGTVSEFFSLTQLSSAALLTLVRSGVNLDAEVAAFETAPPDDLAESRRYWERREGMRATIPADSVVVDSRDVFASTADAELWVIRGDHPVAQRADPYARRVFRDFHPLDNNPGQLFDDGNGYRIILGSLGVKQTLSDVTALLAPARTFDTVTNAVTGGVYYGFNKYQIQVGQQPVLVQGVDPAENDPPQPFNRAREYSLGPYNVENLYDYVDDPFDGCDFAGNPGCPGVNPPFDYVPPSDAVYQARLGLIAEQIVNDLYAPDILMIAEAEDQDICTVVGGVYSCGATDDADGKPDTLQELAVRIAAIGGPSYDAVLDRDGADDRGITAGFLYRTDRVELVPIDAGHPIFGSSPTVSYPGAAFPSNSDVQNPKAFNAGFPPGFTCGSAPNNCDGSNVFTRAPQVGLFRIYSTAVGVGEPVTLYALSNHFSSTPDARVRQRREQAAYNAAIVAAVQAGDPGALVTVGGDLNVYPRPDEPIPTNPTDQLGPLYDQGLVNLFDTILAENPSAAYGYIFQGQTQTLDHIFASASLYSRLVAVREAHVNADFPADFDGDGPRGLSDHDPQIARFLLDDTAPSTTASVSGATNPLCPADCFQGSATVTLSASDTQSGVTSTQYRVNGGALQTYSGPFTVSTLGANLVEFFSTDAAGNVEATRSIVVKVTDFPGTAVLDGFNRPDGRLGGDWTGATQRDQYALSGGSVTVDKGGLALWRPTVFGASQEAFMRLTAINAGSAHHTLALKVRGTNGSGGAILVSYDAAGQQVTVEALVPGQGFRSVASYPLALQAGALLGARALSDGTVQVYVDCALVGTADTRTAAGNRYVGQGGRIGVSFLAAAGATFDDFGGGNTP